MADKLVPAGVKLAVRADRDAGVIRAYFSTLDDTERIEVGTLSIAVADRLRPAFDAWVEGMTRVVNLMTEDVTGQTVVRNDRYTPADKN